MNVLTLTIYIFWELVLSPLSFVSSTKLSTPDLVMSSAFLFLINLNKFIRPHNLFLIVASVYLSISSIS
jgi:hypothetical protein